MIDSLATLREPRNHELLHTATPWHNCIIKVQDDKTLYLAKSRVADEAAGGNRETTVKVEGEDLPYGRYVIVSKS